MTMNPTLYLYRFPGPRGPGPYTMKYWWTLGCFPTGREMPFRLQEFLLTYQQEHVPIEVEEWLRCFVKDPLQELQNASKALFDAAEASPEMESTRGYRAIQPSIIPLLAPMEKFGRQLGVKISPTGLRAVLSNTTLKERFLDDLFEYQEILEKEGSTPHRRLARRSLEKLLPEGEAGESFVSTQQIVPVSKNLGNFVGAVISPPDTTAADERKLIHLLTTISEGCAGCGHYDDARSMLAGALMFCHDADAQAVTHANLAISSFLNGDFREAEYNGREAALLQPEAKYVSSAGARGYAVWAAAVAYQDDFDRAERIIHDALALYSGNEELKNMSAQLQKIRVAQASLSYSGEVPELLRGSRCHLPSQQSKALAKGNGKGFDNEFDWVLFKNKLYPSKMNPSTNEMGSVFRRVGDMGMLISSSRSMERL
ncbi:hypothetical protein TraAM80_07683 [Trypanosoma rangeli]|uniref:Uncharacterized protein n=1 Tax=Trypanosoma rangeli TaxID=5698 RepID=A0A3R7M6E1_TRYRA|nr:uncharacterized protein TraAM80_07683 [Trypanosoma rangeli]RNF00283.1 hypothetical protein TraAM80_07683 [Trypanosoma rangeli]|eukprot:RNF00283.1 hypothetical protein TraAM80_07683 [Trypanosoma rangeli]